jgi:putative heme-binding domain-containing protein
VRNVVGTSQLFISYRALSDVAIVLPEKIDGPSLAERLAASSSGSYTIPPEFLEVDWSKEAASGDAERGRALFETIGCAKCHAVSAEAQGTGGPSLADSARRFTIAHLVESVLAPSKQVSPIFKSTLLQTKDGRQFTGLVVSETAEKIELLQPDTKRVTLAKADIEERQLQELSPMPQGLVRKPDELRDLLAYLLRGK